MSDTTRTVLIFFASCLYLGGCYALSAYRKTQQDAREYGFRHGVLWQVRYEQCNPGKVLPTEVQTTLSDVVEPDPFAKPCKELNEFVEAWEKHALQIRELEGKR